MTRLLARNDFVRTNPVQTLREAARALWDDSDPHASRAFLSELVGGLTNRHGVRFPRRELDRMAALGWIAREAAEAHGRDPEPPGVVGLVVHAETGTGFVCPLAAEPNPARWEVDPQLPFAAAELVDAVARLAAGSGRPDVVPEAFPYRVTGGLGHGSRGESMTVAGLLAVASVAAGRPPALRAACAVVQPGRGGALEPVRGSHEKLAAFEREYGAGTLLVRHPSDADAAGFDHLFGAVWPVRTFADLAAGLDRAGVLTDRRPGGPPGLLVRRPLTAAEVERVRAQILGVDVNLNLDRWAQARRLAAAELHPLVPLRTRLGVLQLLGDCSRACGRWAVAADAAARAYDLVDALGPDRWDDALAAARCDLAAAYFQQFRFEDARKVLAGWVDRVEADPAAFTPETRRNLWNTLGRVLAVLAADGWDGWFRKSIDLQQRVDPAEVGRTRNYLIHGLVNRGRAGEAAALIDAAEAEYPEPLARLHPLSRVYLRFYRAGAARGRGEDWTCPEVEALVPDRFTAHVLGYYHLTVGRRLADAGSWPAAADRLGKARGLFLREVDETRGGTELPLLHVRMAELAAAACGTDPARWREAVDALAGLVGAAGLEAMRDHLAPALDRLGPTPDWAAADAVLTRVPYF